MSDTQVVNESQKHSYYPILDLVRFIAALLIISIHCFPENSTESGVGLDNSIPTMLGLSFLYSLVRIAVPIFFVISSFVVFKRIEEDPSNKWKYIKKFCLRLLCLYLFWYILGLPLTIKDIVSFVSQGDTHNLIRYIVITLWKGAPRGYWFLVSLAVGVVIAALCKTKKSMIVFSITSVIMYIYGCFNSAYFGVFELNDNPFSKALFQVGNYLELNFCYLQAFLFIALGKIFALRGTFKIKGNVYLIPVAYLLLVGEMFLTKYLGIFYHPDALFLLPALVLLIMNLVLNIDIQNEKFASVVKKLKKVGSFSYLFHVQFFAYLYWILDSVGHNIVKENFVLAVIPYFVCIGLCFALQTLFEYLSQYKYLSFLKYSY